MLTAIRKCLELIDETAVMARSPDRAIRPDRRFPASRGSFDGSGGHNFLEAARFAIPVVCGPKMRNFADACLYDKETQAPAEHGLMVQKMLDGIYASAAAGKEVKID